MLIATALAGLVACSSHSAKPRGAATAQAAAQRFTAAVNAGNGPDATAISCTGFTAQARQAATTGADPGIHFALGAVQVTGTGATAALVENLDVGGFKQSMNFTLTLAKKSGLWLVCGRR